MPTHDDSNPFTRGLYDGYTRVDDAIPFPTLPSSPGLPEPSSRVSYVLQDALATLRMLHDQFLSQLPEPGPLAPRQRVANCIGTTFWQIGNAVAHAGTLIENAGDRIIDAGDDFAEWVAGR